MPEGTMRALWYNSPRDFEIKQVPIPKCGDDDVLLKDAHIHEGEFIAKFPLIPGHEAIGKVVEVGKNVKDFQLGDRVVADVGISCDNCFYCRRGQAVLCENFHARGVTQDGGFAEYIVYHQKKCYKIHNLTDEESTLLEPAACAIHGLDKLNPPVGIDVLLLGAGPTGLILAQLLKLNGAHKVVIAANKGIKMDIAKKLNAGDEYIELDRNNPAPQWDKLQDDNPYGFDVVVEATGVEKLAQDSMRYVRRGGTIMIYGVYENKAMVHWPPSKIFGDEIKASQPALVLQRLVELALSRRLLVHSLRHIASLELLHTLMEVTDVFKLEDYQAALDKMSSRGALKIAIKP
ncbi:hypothetical protein NLI96_g100 [Meripilus lineatus]|uniref:Uncharacterized protein n=1 Tax=Meripilus lineatus TaxID=2056292 RepID=A0AAD5VCX6_9APHY|nr:hypothetical protein NLI96_g100 [Physisporinus lineatus]